MDYVVCMHTSSGGHLTVSTLLELHIAKMYCNKVKAVKPHIVRKDKDGPRCRFVVQEDLSWEFNSANENTLYTSERLPHVSGGWDFNETILLTDKAYVWKVHRSCH